LRAADDNIVRFADMIGANARVAFHLSLNDALLKDYIGMLKPRLTRLDVPQDEAIAHSMVTRAIVGAQAKKGS
jgi:preprotein translocase subunit SecA